MILQPVLGFFTFLASAWLLSENRKYVTLRPIVAGVLLQLGLAILITQFPFVRHGFESLSHGIEALKTATTEGTSFVFGYLGGGAIPFAMDPSSTAGTFIFALQALPMIMVVSALSMLLFYWGILPVIVKAFSWLLNRWLNIGGALGVAAAAKVFFGNLEAPLLIRPYLSHFSRSELFAVMTCGMATTSATAMALYCSILENTIPNPIAHILTASIISIPAALTIARLMVPHEGAPTSGHLVAPYQFNSSMDALSKGTSDGLNIFLNVMAMLIVVIAVVTLVNIILGLFPAYQGTPWTLQGLFGIVMAPMTWLMGIPWSEAVTAGKLLGTKTALNEVVAFLELSKLPTGAMSPHSSLIMMYALCGFANFASVGIVIAGLGTLVPERRQEIVSLGLKSVLAGTLATCMSGTLIGFLTKLSPTVIP